MKTYLSLITLLVCCFCVQSKNEKSLTEEELEFLKNLKVSQIPRHIRLQLLKHVRSGINSNSCCKNDHQKDNIVTQVPNQNLCPDDRLHCCPGYVLVADYCLESNSEKLEQIAAAVGLHGILG